MVRMIMELVRNRSFTLTTGDSKQSRLRRLKNGVPQGSVLAPLLFNIYTYDLPSMISRKFVYADNLALLYSSGNWKDLEGTLSQDMSTLSAYLQTWRLKLSHTKTVTAADGYDLPGLHKKVRDLLMKQREDIVKTIRGELNAIKLRDGRFSITFGESTSMRNRRYMNINVHF